MCLSAMEKPHKGTPWPGIWSRRITRGKIFTLSFWWLVLNFILCKNHICQALHDMLLTIFPSQRIPRHGWPDISYFACPQGTRLVRERRRVARILLLLAVLFAFCWLPYNVVSLLFDLGINKNIELFSYTLLLGHANSAINPILYCFMTRNFRRAVRELVLCSRVSLATRPHQRLNVSTVRGLVSSRTIYTILAHNHVLNLSTTDSYWAIYKFIVHRHFKLPCTCMLNSIPESFRQK